MDPQNIDSHNTSAYYFGQQRFLRDSSLINLIQLEIYQDSGEFLQGEIQFKDSSQSQTEKLTMSNTQNQRQLPQENQIQLMKQNLNTNSKTVKTKKIQKCNQLKKDKKLLKSPKKDKQSLKKAKSSLGGNKSKYNNMGTFLIGTFSDILNSGDFRLQKNYYQILINKNWITIFNNDGFQNADILIEMLTSLKKKVFTLPRKQGAKKDLYKIINDEENDSKQIRTCKNLIRKEVIFYMSSNEWLQQHAQSRDFRPQNDDSDGTKKKERHQAYLDYLLAIKKGLEQKNEIPKRLSL